MRRILKVIYDCAEANVLLRTVSRSVEKNVGASLEECCRLRLRPNVRDAGEAVDEARACLGLVLWG